MFFLLGAFYFAACSYKYGDAGSQSNAVKGFIVVVGNEPFTKLAIKLDNGKNYLLDCSEELKKELWKQQGNYYTVQFSKSRMEGGVPVLVVEKVTPLNQNTNK